MMLSVVDSPTRRRVKVKGEVVRNVKWHDGRGGSENKEQGRTFELYILDQSNEQSSLSHRSVRKSFL